MVLPGNACIARYGNGVPVVQQMPKHGGPARQSGLSPAGEAATAEIEELGDALLLGPLTAVDAAKKEQAKAAAAMMRKGRKKDGRGASQPKKRRRRS